MIRALCEDDPANDGLLDPVSIVVPSGCLLNPGPGHAVAGGNVETSQRIVDVLLGAIAGAIPDRIPAASQGTMNNLAFSGARPDGAPFTYYETVAGGAGGHPRAPGASGIHTHMTNSLNTPVEALERALPVRVARYAYRRGSGGGGLHAGGDGLVREIEALAPLEGTLLADRRRIAPWGCGEGGDGQPGADWIERGGVDPLPSKGKVLPGPRRQNPDRDPRRRRVGNAGGETMSASRALRVELVGGAAIAELFRRRSASSVVTCRPGRPAPASVSP